LVIPILISTPDLLQDLFRRLEKRFGTIDYTSETIDFTFTDYYLEEMGENIQRMFISFSKLIDPGLLPDIKITTNGIEDFFSVNGTRRINLDPGLLALSRFVLATTKENAHRIPLRQGIYGEITLIYRKNDFQVLPWTYPDYRTEAYRKILREIRDKYKQDLKQQ
jgi:hypothetical protein